MSREILERMTKEELMEFVRRQDELIDSLNQQRYDASAAIDNLVRTTQNMQNLRYHDAERESRQDIMDDFVREMYAKYPLYIVSVEKVEEGAENENSD